MTTAARFLPLATTGREPLQEVPEAISGDCLLTWRRTMLARGGRSADLDWLLDLAGGIPWVDLQALRLHPERIFFLPQGLVTLEELWLRHLRTAEPLQYLVGRCPWRELQIRVGPGVLIPRQETELLPDLALGLLPPGSATRPLLWADLGTGSGCLAVALARAFPSGQGIAVDVSAEALAIAAVNLAAAGVEDRVTLRRGDWWQGWGTLQGSPALVVANPPYIPTGSLADLEPGVRDHEPTLALDGGVDGLAAISTILAGAHAALAPGGVLLVEHHHDQSERVCTLMAASGLDDVRAHEDLEGKLRFASGRRATDRGGS
jgi:release factor glutamine methyltransferase